MNIHFTTTNMSTYQLTEEPEGTYTVERFNPVRNVLVKDFYEEMEIIELGLGRSAHIKSKELGHGDLVTSPVTWIGISK